MDNFYLVILAFLAILACFDLFVGVSNDAVNFLNSALGCRIATYRTTMIVASHLLFGDDGNRTKRRFSSADVYLCGNHGDLFCRDGQRRAAA